MSRVLAAVNTSLSLVRMILEGHTLCDPLQGVNAATCERLGERWHESADSQDIANEFLTSP